MMISVCINTKNRHQELMRCLRSIQKNKFKNYEIIVIDQSDSSETEIELSRNQKIKYFADEGKGVGHAKNVALSKAKGEIIAFTDDDCLVDKNWLRNIYTTFRKHRDISGVFGQVLPYQPEKHQGKICPCTFEKKKEAVITHLCRHWEHIGFGNNMAFRKKVFRDVGNFKDWLGPGSIGANAEDAEFALRLLSKGYKILYSPQIKIHHNRWLTNEEYRKQCLIYSCGEVACYGYFAFNGMELGKEIVRENFLDSYYKLRRGAKSLMCLQREGIRITLNALEELFYRLRGSVIAFWFSNK